MIVEKIFDRAGVDMPIDEDIEFLRIIDRTEF